MTIDLGPFPSRLGVRTVLAMPAPTVTLTLPEASALALVLNTAEATALDSVTRTAAADALDLLQDATTRTAGPEFVTLS